MDKKLNEVKNMSVEKKHPVYELPNEPHAKHRYASAMKHVTFAKEAGKSPEEIHKIFARVMNFNPDNAANIPQDEAHKKYRSAIIHMKKALENGKTAEEAHRIFKDIIAGNTEGKCHHKD